MSRHPMTLFQRLDPSTPTVVLAMVRGGHSQRHVADLLGIGQATVSRLVTQANYGTLPAPVSDADADTPTGPVASDSIALYRAEKAKRQVASEAFFAEARRQLEARQAMEDLSRRRHGGRPRKAS